MTSKPDVVFGAVVAVFLLAVAIDPRWEDRVKTSKQARTR